MQKCEFMCRYEHCLKRSLLEFQRGVYAPKVLKKGSTGVVPDVEQEKDLKHVSPSQR